MTDGKNAVGLTGFPTPNTAAGIAGYLLLLFEDKEWAQWILGALEPLAYAYNFYESGDLSPDEAAEAFRQIVQQAPYNLKTCANPAGGKILRISPDGRVQQLSDANTWETPDGDYTIPPVPARTDGTPPDQICLAAKNAANVLQILYENVSDSFQDGLSQAAAGVALIEAISLVVGSEFAPITFAIVSVSAAIFGAFYGIMEFITADLWTEDFTNVLACILQECASNDAGVVTFDWDCFNNALAAQVTIVPITFDQLRLFGQIQYLLWLIGGADALDQAGATTAITDDDCSFCDTGWCWVWDFTIDEQGWSPFGIYGTYVMGLGWQSVAVGSSYSLILLNNDPVVFTSDSWTVVMDYNIDPSGDPSRTIQYGSYVGSTFTLEYGWTPTPTTNPSTYSHTATENWNDALYINPNGGTGGYVATVKSITLRGTGDVPSFAHGAAC